jgi:hypothetical protein
MKLAILLCAAAGSASAREVRFDTVNVLRPAFGAAYAVNDHRVELKRGTVVFHLENSGAPPVEIVTPSVTIQPYFAGDYRVEVNRFGETVIVPYGGDLRVVAPSGSQWLPVGQKMIARGSAADPEFRIVSAVSRWRRFADRLANIAHIAWSSGGASYDSGDSSQSDDSGAKPAAPKPDTTPKSSPPKPTEGSRGSSAPATQRGK